MTRGQQASLSYSLNVPAEPHSGKVAPAQLADDVVPSIEQIPNLDVMVATYAEK